MLLPFFLGGCPAIYSYQTITTSDTYLGSRRIDSLGAGAVSTTSSSFAVPGGVTEGTTWYVGALIDSANEVAELFENNNTSDAYAVTIDPALPADLTVSGLGATSTVPAGEVLTVNDTVSNSGYSAAGVDVYYYLSTDNVITTADRYVGSRSIAVLETDISDANPGLDIQLPRDYPTGTYYMGAIVDPNNRVLENNDSDNVSNTVTVTVTTPVPSNLAFSAFTPETAVNTYNEMSITDTVVNNGTGDETGFLVSYYLSTDGTIDPGADTLLGTRTINALPAAGSDTGTVTFSINRAVGTYYVGALIDLAGQAVESDVSDNGSTVVPIDVVNPDVSMEAVAVSPTVVQLGDTITIDTTVANIGPADITDSFSVSYFLSIDSQITTGDIYLGYRTINGLAAGAIDVASDTDTIPTDLTFDGTYYVGAIVDRYNYLDEIYTANNTSAFPVSISISGVCSPDAFEEDDSDIAAKVIGVGDTQTHNFCQDTEDWLAFDATSGLSYTIETFIPNSAGTDTVLRIYDSTGTQLAYDDDSGSGWESLISGWVAPATATYYIKVSNLGGPGNLEDYSVNLRTPWSGSLENNTCESNT